MFKGRLREKREEGRGDTIFVAAEGKRWYNMDKPKPKTGAALWIFYQALPQADNFPGRSARSDRKGKML